MSSILWFSLHVLACNVIVPKEWDLCTERWVSYIHDYYPWTSSVHYHPVRLGRYTWSGNRYAPTLWNISANRKKHILDICHSRNPKETNKHNCSFKIIGLPTKNHETNNQCRSYHCCCFEHIKMKGHILLNDPSYHHSEWRH